MNFFEHQDTARRLTTRLVWLFLLAVVLIVAAVDLVVLGVLLILDYEPGYDVATTIASVDPFYFVVASSVTILIIALGTAIRMAQLSKGGKAVAKMMGARLVDSNTGDPAERRLLNVVEEMALASGTPVPDVFVMDEEVGINAFAAGFTPRQAVIAVTRGTMTRLTRDELQGVIAHEFSHILNGDMRLNIRLMGVLNGIVIIGAIGMHILRGAGRGRIRSSRNGGQAILVALAVGVALAAIGYIGVFIGRMIKSAVSRQREFLADASAVQFTRNPAGIAGALNKIRGYIEGSTIQNRHAEEMSHMLFGAGFTTAFSRLLATHPPLEERIKRIAPGFDLSVLPDTRRESQVSPASDDAEMLRGVAAGHVTETGRQPVAATPSEVVASVGSPAPRHLAYARTLFHGLPEAIRDQLSQAHGAQAVILCLLLDTDETLRRRQLQQLHARPDGTDMAAYIEQLYEAVAALGPVYRLPLIDLAMPAIKRATDTAKQQFLHNQRLLIAADSKTTLAEYVVYSLSSTALAPDSDKAQRLKFSHLQPVLPDCAVLVSLLAYAGHGDPDTVSDAFADGMATLGVVGATLPERGLATVSTTQHALERLRLVVPLERMKVVDACARTVLHDKQVTLRETELLRAVSAALDCPMPPVTNRTESEPAC